MTDEIESYILAACRMVYLTCRTGNEWSPLVFEMLKSADVAISHAGGNTAISLAAMDVWEHLSFDERSAMYYVTEYERALQKS